MMHMLVLAGVSLLVAAGCGGSCPPPREPEAPAPASEAPAPAPVEEAAEPPPEPEQTSSPEEEAKPAENATPEPKFPEDATVAQAMAAVPQGTDRANIEPEILAEPLQNAALYEPCKVGTQHFKLRVAVWAGRAVGVDVVTPNKKLAECVARQVRGIEWRDRVPSLNTIDFSM